MRLDYELAATVLAEATLEDDRTVCERHGITPRTLRNYRYRLQSDPELSLLFRERLRTLEREWANELAPAIRQAVRFLQRAAQVADPRDPRAIEAVAEALRVLSEVSMTREVLQTRLEGPQGRAN
ncbi:MAG: hypothetical protein N2Z75_05925 [Meiothermus sp.]|nr:hypothetical protein [Meiothermus sp.]